MRGIEFCILSKKKKRGINRLIGVIFLIKGEK
jgi:hypothetical protein